MMNYGKTIFIASTDDTILLGPDKDEIDTLVKWLGKTFQIEDQGELSDYLELEWTQPTLTQSILKDLKFDGEEVKGRQKWTKCQSSTSKHNSASNWS
jgi:hypothetical protein